MRSEIVMCLTEQQQKEIVELIKRGHTRTGVAHRFGVSTRTVGRVWQRFGEDDVVQSPTPVKPAVEAPVKSEPVSIGAVQKSWVANNKFLSITIGSETINASSTHEKFKEAIQLLLADKIDEAADLVNIKVALSRYVKGHVTIDGSVLKYKDLAIDSGLTKRIIELMNNGEDFDFLINFLENLMLNPSRRAVYELYDFLDHNDIEITEDGYFIAWKRVNEDYTDMYTGTMDNSPGKRVEVPRNMVDEDSNVTCSHGLHVAAKHYIPHYGGGCGRVIACKVNPRDVAAIPSDYQNSKMRTCGYDVLKDVTAEFVMDSHF